MKIIVLTDDSRVKLPTINKWKNTLGKGKDITKNEKIMSLLMSKKYDFPTDDFFNEDKYQDVLKEFIRPARLMFAGMFSEVRVFADELLKKNPTDLYILSGRYGLINESQEIIPYNYHIDNIEKLKELDHRTKFLKGIQNLLEEQTILIISLPQQYIDYFFKYNFFKSIPQKVNVIVVTLNKNKNKLQKISNVFFLHRRGVARLGEHNREEINKIIAQFEISYRSP
jgi:hypothetical protein